MLATALIDHLARLVSSHDQEGVELALARCASHGVPPTLPDAFGLTPLASAIYADNAAACARILEIAPEAASDLVIDPSGFWRPMLHLACEQRRDACAALVAPRSDLRALDSGGRGALAIAATRGGAGWTQATSDTLLALMAERGQMDDACEQLRRALWIMDGGEGPRDPRGLCEVASPEYERRRGWIQSLLVEIAIAAELDSDGAASREIAMGSARESARGRI